MEEQNGEPLRTLAVLRFYSRCRNDRLFLVRGVEDAAPYPYPLLLV